MKLLINVCTQNIICEHDLMKLLHLICISKYASNDSKPKNNKGQKVNKSANTIKPLYFLSIFFIKMIVSRVKWKEVIKI